MVWGPRSNRRICGGPVQSALLSAMLSVVGMYGLTVWGEAASDAPDPELQQFIVEMSEKHGFDAGSLERLLGKARLSTSVLRAMTQPAEAKPWEEYRALFVNEERVERGLQFWDRHADVLASARTAYGVSESVVTAIIGVESGYGRNTGRFRVLDALFTLAFNHTERPEQFRRELESFLLLAREEDIAPLSLKGSYAGAIGPAQFMPTSYREFAVDFDGDGKRDLVRNPVDAIGSVANYLMRHGWNPGEPMVVPIRIEPEAPLDGRFDFEARPVGEWKRIGVVPLEETVEDRAAMLIVLPTAQGAEPWLVFENFRVITRYNRSTSYAMAVYQLGREIETRRLKKTETVE